MTLGHLYGIKYIQLPISYIPKHTFCMAWACSCHKIIKYRKKKITICYVIRIILVYIWYLVYTFGIQWFIICERDSKNELHRVSQNSSDNFRALYSVSGACQMVAKHDTKIFLWLLLFLFPLLRLFHMFLPIRPRA